MRRDERKEVSIKLLLCDSRLLRHVDTVQEFTDILVPYPADTLDRRSFRSISIHVRNRMLKAHT